MFWLLGNCYKWLLHRILIPITKDLFSLIAIVKLANLQAVIIMKRENK